MNVWTEELTAKVLELYAKGDSAAEIAFALGRGFTRNSVLGKIHRSKEVGAERKRAGRESSGLKQAARASRERVIQKRQAKPLPKFKPVQAAAPVPLAGLTLTSCRWPVNSWAPGRSDEALFCGAHHELGSAYCEKCRKRSVQVRAA